MIALFTASLSCFAATLRGVVNDDDGYPVSGAKVVIFHEMAMVMVQRTVCDRRGQYQFNMEPGPYRIFVLKKGYHAAKTKAMILHEKELVELSIQLLPEDVDPNDQSSKNLKRILRRENRGPHRDILNDSLIQTSLAPIQDDSLIGSVRTQSHQGLDGNATQSATVSVNARIHPSVAVASELTTDDRYDTTLFKAGLSVNIRALALGVQAQTITAESHGLGRSQHFQISGSFDEQIRGSTSLDYRESEALDLHHQELELRQDVSYHLNQHAFRHEVQLTDWKQARETAAVYAALSTDWSHQGADSFGLRSDVAYLNLPQARNLATQLWVTSEQKALNDRLAMTAAVGVRREDGQNNLVQNYHLAWRPGRLQFQALFKDQFNYRPYASYDVFGSYLDHPMTPYAQEGFYRTENRELGATAAIAHGSGLISTLNWRRRDDGADLLSLRTDSGFLTHAQHRAQTLAYVLQAERSGIRLELSYGENEGLDKQFDHTQLAYAQTVQSFREKGLGLLFEFHLMNQPNLPAWWLLENPPWNTEEESLWYEGRLSLQF